MCWVESVDVSFDSRFVQIILLKLYKLVRSKEEDLCNIDGFIDRKSFDS